MDLFVNVQKNLMNLFFQARAGGEFGFSWSKYRSIPTFVYSCCHSNKYIYSNQSFNISCKCYLK